MSVCWETHRQGTHYSVRCAGSTVRLYSNGVFHSQWNPQRPFAGGIWDCLSLPVLYQPNTQIQRILLLGAGGGAVIRQLDYLLPFVSLVALEIDPIHIKIARKWFEVRDSRVELVQTNAMEWVDQYKGKTFDLVIDDLFGHAEGEPVRAQALDVQWLSRLDRLLGNQGMLVVNCINPKQLKSALPAFSACRFEAGYHWRQSTYENAIAVLLHQGVAARDWSSRLISSDLSAPMQRQARAIIRRPLRLPQVQ